MRNPYEAPDPGGAGWRDSAGQRNGMAPPWERASGSEQMVGDPPRLSEPEPGPDHTLPQRPPPDLEDTGTPQRTASLSYPLPPPAPPPPLDRGRTAPPPPLDRGRTAPPPPLDRGRAAPPRRDSGYGARPDDDRDAGHTAPAVDPLASPSADVEVRRAAHRDEDATATAAPAAAEPHVDVEPAVPVGQQIRDSLGRMGFGVRRSIPLRTVLFLLPPLALPALAFDLSVGATLLVALTLLWLAAASAVFCTMMLEGAQQLTLRSVEHRGDRAPAGDAGDDDLQEALVAIGAQLDKLSDAVAALRQDPVPLDVPRRRSDARATPSDGAREPSAHRPEERWPAPPREDQFDRYGQTAGPDTNWSESRWRR